MSHLRDKHTTTEAVRAVSSQERDSMNLSIDDLGPLLAKRRADLGLSVREAGLQSGVPPATFSRVENGRSPDLSTFQRLVEWLGLPPDRFFRAMERTESTPDAIDARLRLDPALSEEGAETIATMVKTMYESLRRQESRQTVHLRAAKTFDPRAMRVLGDLLGDLQSSLENVDRS